MVMLQHCLQIFVISQTNKWCAQINMNKKRIGLGCFVSEVEAAMVYNQKSKELLGEFAVLNIVSNHS
jgi:hypothetical protein